MIRIRLQSFIENARVQQFIIALILLNAVLLGMETSPSVMESAATLILTVDKAILTLFVLEILVRIYVYRLAFWRDPWSLFDFTVVTIALVPASGPFAVLRALRVLRVLRLLTMVPSMRRVVGALLGAIPGLASIGVMLLIFFYVFAVIATNLFGASHPEWFGTLGRSFYTLFQIMTLESWSMGIVRPVMEVYPQAWLYFIPFILIATFTMLNLFIAIIVDTMQTMHHAEHEEEREHIEEVVHEDTDALGRELRSLREEIGQLRTELKENR